MACNIIELAVVPDVWAKPPNSGNYFLAFHFPNSTGQFEKVKCFFQRYGLYTLLCPEFREFRFLLAFSCANLDHGTVTSDFCINRVTALWVFSQKTLSCSFVGLFHCFFHTFVKRIIEAFDHFFPLFTSAGYFI